MNMYFEILFVSHEQEVHNREFFRVGKIWMDLD